MRKRAEERLLQLTTHDPHTGLANKGKCVETLAHAIAQAKRYRHVGAVLLLDLDGFKTVNDAYGHDVGDQVLHEVARRLLATSRASGSVARLGGDEFAVVLGRIEHVEHAGVVAQRIIDALAAPFEAAGQPWSLGVSIGISLFPSDGLMPDGLLSCADAAMYAVKHTGMNGFRYHQAPSAGD